MREHRVLEQHPVMRAAYEQRLIGNGFSAPPFVSWEDYWGQWLPGAREATTDRAKRDAVYSPAVVAAFEVAYKRGLIGNGALARLNTRRLRASGANF